MLNEPETSLHPDLVPALARLIINATQATQIIVVSHNATLIAALTAERNVQAIVLEKSFGETHVAGQRSLDRPPWHWPAR